MSSAAGRVALVTGGAMGMGRLVGEHFLKDGAKLVIWDMNEAVLNKTVEELKKISKSVFGYIVDVTNKDKVMELAKKVEKEVGPVDILVNNAGIAAGGYFTKVPIEKHIKVIDVNINAVMICTWAFLPGMMERNSGHIINIASAAGLMGVGGLSSYCASKFAVVGFTETINLELHRNNLTGVKTTTVCPSFVTTGMFEGAKAPMLTPFMTPQKMAGKIYEAFKKDKVIIKEPFAVKSIPIIKSMTVPRHFIKVADMLGVTKAMDDYTGREKAISDKSK